MKRTWLLVVALAPLALGACKQDIDDAVVPVGDFAASYAAAVCENQVDCCDADFDVDDCKLAGEASARAFVDTLVVMEDAIYHSDRAVECLQNTETSASNCVTDFATDCADVFESVSAPADAGAPSIEAQCEGDLF
jgi:hypothetical protein